MPVVSRIQTGCHYILEITWGTTGRVLSGGGHALSLYCGH